MSARAASLLAWSLFAVFIAVVLATLLLIFLGPGRTDNVFFVAVLGFALVGALVASREPANAVGWLLLAVGLTLALGVLFESYIAAEDVPGQVWVGWLDWTWHVWLTLAAIFLPLVFPNGRLVSRRWRPVIWIGACALALSVLAAALKPGRLGVDAGRALENPLGVEGAEGVLSAAATLGNVLAAIAFLLAGASLVVRFRRSRGVERQQLKWFAYVGLLAVGGLLLAMTQVLFGLEEGDPETGAGVLEAVGAIGWFLALGAIVIGIPLATGMAILRHRLYDIDVVIRRTLVYAGLTAALLASYLGLVLVLQLVLSPLTEKSDLAIAGSTLGVAALFGPARSRIQQAVDRRFYRSRYDARRTVEAFGARLRDEVELDALSGELHEVVRNTMQPSHVSLWLR